VIIIDFLKFTMEYLQLFKIVKSVFCDRLEGE
jgi:hypothetical protein